MTIIGYIIIAGVCLFFSWFFISLIIKLFKEDHLIWPAILIGIMFILMAVSISMIFIKPHPARIKDERVFICTGPQSHAYHKSRRCKGLKKCSQEIMAVTLQEAIDMGLHQCRFCCPDIKTDTKTSDSIEQSLYKNPLQLQYIETADERYRDADEEYYNINEL